MKKFLTTTLVLLLAGCSVVSFDVSDEKARNTPHMTGRNDFYIGGVGQEQIIPVMETCRNGISTLKVKYTFIDGLLAVVTMGIYTPNTYEIYCSRPRK